MSTPKFTILYNGHDATIDISPDLLSVNYTDRARGKSDELSIEIHDVEGKWRDTWYPVKGDTLEMEFGYQGEVIAAGTFEVDEMEISGPPDTISIRALAAGITSPLRTKTSTAFEETTIRELAEEIAGRQGFTVEDGTFQSRRTVINYTEERSKLNEAADDLRKLLLLLTGQLINSLHSSPDNTLLAYQLKWFEQFRAEHIELVNKVYTYHAAKLEEVIQKLSRVGQTGFALEVAQIRKFWGSAWAGTLSFAGMQRTREQMRKRATRMEEIATSLEDVDYTTTSSMLDINFGRITQDNETDLAFLSRVAGKFGVLFNVRGTVIYFTSIYEIEGGDAILTFSRGDLKSYSLKDKATRVYASSRLQYTNPDTGEMIDATAEVIPGRTPSGDVLEVRERVENVPQAEAVAKARLHEANSKSQQGRISVPGNPYLLAGVNVILDGLGVMSGQWVVEESSHTIDAGGGYSTEAVIKRV